MDASDSEDEDIRAAIAMSLATTTSNELPLPPIALVESAALAHGTLAPNGTYMTQTAASGLAKLDRKAMEQERLARLGRKRERSISPPPLSDSRKAPKLDATTIVLPSGAKLRSFTASVNQEQQSRKSDIANAATQQLKRPVEPELKTEDDNISGTAALTTIRYPTGVVKKTWAFGFDRTGYDVKIEEVLEPRTLKTAVLSAFQLDAEWITDKLVLQPNGGNTKCLLVMQAKGDVARQQRMQEAEGIPSLRVCLPSMEGQINCMHSKLMLLFHSEKLRIAIPTANLLNFDWGETGVMENSVWMIDLPRLPHGSKVEVGENTAFCDELLYFLKQQDIDDDVRNGVLNFDFSRTIGMRFVHTTGGAHYGENAERTGLLGLARAVRQLGLQSQDDLQIDFAASSIGALNDDQIRNLHAAARGQDLIANATEATSDAKANFFKRTAAKVNQQILGIRDKVRIYFPTAETVKSSKAGAAGTVCLSRKYYEEMRFPRSCFRDYQSTRTGLLSHNKILYARGKQVAPDGTTKNIAWAYVGSANMSESAWGKLIYDKKAKAWKINCRNWECGVLLPVSQDRMASHEGHGDNPIKREKAEGDDSETESEDEGGTAKTNQEAELLGMEVFDDLVQPPFAIPGRIYDGREPWYFQESQ